VPHALAFVFILFFAPTPGSAGESVASLRDVFQHDFLMGVALNQRQFDGRAEGDAALALRHFNSISPENALKWESLHPNPGPEGFVFEAADRFVAFGVRHGLHVVGHTLVWHSQTPDWVFAGHVPAPGSDDSSTGETGANRPPEARRRRGRGAYDGPRATRDELVARMREHIHTVVGRYKGRIQAWDVVNEALADGNGEEVLRDSLWRQIIGPDYVALAFEFAHEADPDAILRYNDYGLENPVKRRRLIRLVRDLQSRNVPLHAIGTQAHLNVSIDFERMDACLAELASLGLPIHVTELDVNTAVRGQRGTGADVAANARATGGGRVSEADRRQSKAYAAVFKALLKHRDSVEVVTFWGVNDAVSWRRFGSPLLFDGDNQPKPAFEAVMEAAAGAR